MSPVHGRVSFQPLLKAHSLILVSGTFPDDAFLVQQLNCPFPPILEHKHLLGNRRYAGSVCMCNAWTSSSQSQAQRPQC